MILMVQMLTSFWGLASFSFCCCWYPSHKSYSKIKMIIKIIFIQTRSVVIFSSRHKYIWSRNLSKLSEKYCVLYFLFKIVMWIQVKNKASCPHVEQTWRKQNIVLVVDPRAGAWSFWHIMYHIKANRKDRWVRTFLVTSSTHVRICL